jgi:hypothetical protein
LQDSDKQMLKQSLVALISGSCTAGDSGGGVRESVVGKQLVAVVKLIADSENLSQEWPHLLPELKG